MQTGISGIKGLPEFSSIVISIRKKREKRLTKVFQGVVKLVCPVIFHFTFFASRMHYQMNRVCHHLAYRVIYNKDAVVG